jgi:LacI family transcriptional regulator
VAITSRDVAREAGVSQSTVSRAIRGDRRVAPQTRERVLAVVRRHGYTPNAAARSLITSRTYTIGVVVSDITNPFYPQLVDVLHDAFARSGYRLLLFNDRNDRASDEIAPQLQGGSVDGVVITSAMLGSTLAARCRAGGLPVVLLNRDVPGVDADRVISDNVAGGELAAATLLRLGHRRLAVINGPSNTSTSRDRLRGFLDGLARHDCPFDGRLLRGGDYSHATGHRALLDLITSESPPTGVFCANDVIALGALDAAHRAGLRVPDDLSIIGFDDIAMADWELFSLTTVRQPLAEMAEVAARMLVERIEGAAPASASTRLFEPRLITRATTGPPA